MKKAKITKLVSIISAIAIAITILPYSNVKALTNDKSPNVEIITNDKWENFEKDLSELQEKNRITTRTIKGYPFITKEEFFDLAKKYDGAERKVKVNRSLAYSEKLVKGGYNCFASTKSGMKQLRDDYGLMLVLQKEAAVLH